MHNAKCVLTNTSFLCNNLITLGTNLSSCCFASFYNTLFYNTHYYTTLPTTSLCTSASNFIIKKYLLTHLSFYRENNWRRYVVTWKRRKPSGSMQHPPRAKCLSLTAPTTLFYFQNYLILFLIGKKEEIGRAAAQEGRSEGSYGRGLQSQESEERFHDT